MHIDPIGSTPDGPGISAALADAESADDLGTSIRFVSHKASLSSVAIIIVEHRRGLAEVAPARVRMDLFRSTTVGQKRSQAAKVLSLWRTARAVAQRENTTGHSVVATECPARL